MTSKSDLIYPTRMEEMIARWIRETIEEFERAKISQNYLKAQQMKALLESLREMRDKLSKLFN